MNKKGSIALLLNFLLGSAVLTGLQDPPRRRENPVDFDLAGGSQVEFKSFDSAALGRKAEYSVFLPPSYENDQSRRFPVVYFLHGLWNDHTSWTVERYGGMPAQLEDLMKSRAVPEFVLINPNGENSFYTNCVDGSCKFEDMIVADLNRHVESSYRVSSNRSDRAIGGVSMGGYGALKIALKYPAIYASAAGISPIIFTGEDPSQLITGASSRMAQYLTRALAPIYGIPFEPEHWRRNSLIHLTQSAEVDGLNIFFAYGTADRYNNSFPLAEGVAAFDQALKDRGVPHEFKVYDNGPHGWQLVADHLEEVAVFLTQSF